MNLGSMGLDDGMSYEAVQTKLDEDESAGSGTVIGSQAKNLYGDINKFNNELLRI
jgi:hypothetical protein